MNITIPLKEAALSTKYKRCLKIHSPKCHFQLDYVLLIFTKLHLPLNNWVLAGTMWPTNHVANTYINSIHWNMYMYFILIFLSLKINKTEELDICFTIKCLEIQKRKSLFFHRQPLLCCAFGKLGTIRPNVIGKSQN